MWNTTEWRDGTMSWFVTQELESNVKKYYDYK